MVLSKDNIDVVEDIKILELTSAQKRRLRRKKLKVARAGILDKNINVQKESLGFTTQPYKCSENNQEWMLNKKQKHKCDTQILNKTQNHTVFKENSLINIQESNCEKPVISHDIKPTIQDTDLNKNYKSTYKDTKNQRNKGDNPQIITNNSKLNKPENSLKIAEQNPECDKPNLKERHKAKLNGNHQIKPENFCTSENKKNKSGSSLLSENQTTTNLELNEKQAIVSQNLFYHENESSQLKAVNKNLSHVPSDKNHVLNKEEIVETFKSDTHNINLKNLKLENREPQTTESIDNVTIQNTSSTYTSIQNMGKIQDTLGSRQEGVTNIKSKKGDSSSVDASAKSREDIKAAREAKKLAKQKSKKKEVNVGENVEPKTSKIETEVTPVKDNIAKTHVVSIDKTEKSKTAEPVCNLNCKENIPPTEKAKAEDKVKNNCDENSKNNVKSETTAKKPEEVSKSKAELRAERRAKQEAQRAAKQETQRAAKQATDQKAVAPEVKDKEPTRNKEEKSAKVKSGVQIQVKSKTKTQSVQKVGWFQHLYVEKDKKSLNDIPINSNLHPAVVKLGVRLAERVVTGSNARCIALLDAIKKMVRDYSLPARTEFGRGLQAQLAAAADFLWSRRAPAASETNALKHFRRQLTHLPADIDEFDAKKQLQEEIDRYIREQIDMAGEAISLILRNKISPGDHILTYGCSTLIERVLCSAWEAGVRFRATVGGARGQHGPEMLRRLRARGVPAAYADISALSYVMTDVQKVLLGAGALLAHGAALGAAGSAQTALVARARNVPVLVACETHKFSERTHLDPLVCHDIGDPDELIDKTDPNSPIKEWRSNPNLTLLNVTYDVTPPSLITAVVTELGILPCTSAPVVLRFKQSEYGM